MGKYGGGGLPVCVVSLLRGAPPCLLPFPASVISLLKRLHVYCIYAVLPYEDCMNMCFSNS